MLKYSTSVLKAFGGGVYLYQHILKCFNFDEKTGIALENILMEKSREPGKVKSLETSFALSFHIQ